METKHKKLTSKAGLTIPKDIRLAAALREAWLLTSRRQRTVS
ncbi:MAG: hypothetical protein ACLVIP_02645 [Ruminococcus sp.]